MAIEKEKLVWMFRTMTRIRRFEERVAREFADGNIPGSVHLYIGEEAVATGAIAHLKKEDYIMSTHRGHGHLIAKGGETNKMMAELFAKETGAIVTVEDSSIIGGLGGAVAEIVAENAPATVKRVGIKDRFGQSGTVPELKEEYEISARHIAQAVRQAVKKK
jgi:TPP-dependent pyruvate/acetoin dehydrogenase alpha subunit